MKRSMILIVATALALSACGLQVPTLSANPVGDGGYNNPDGSFTDPGDGFTDPTNPGPSDPGGPSGPSGPDLPGPDDPSGPADPDLPKGITPYGFESETEGVRNDAITLCTHVPISGAAPINRHAARFGQFYFDYVNKELGGIHGRKVNFLAFDDKYNPTGAREAFESCRRQGAFIYLGAAGTDQIVSVAKRAEEYRVPYMHGPTSDKDMGGSRFNIHAAPTYEDQHRYLARYLVGRYGKNVNYGMVRVSSVYFEAGHDAFVSELKKLGVTLKVDVTVQKDEPTFGTIISKLRSENVQVVNNFTTPSIWLRMIPQASGYRPTWTAASPVAGYNLLSNALGNGAKAVVMHHFNPACNCNDYTQRDRSLPYAGHMEKFLDIFRKYSPETDPPVDDFDYGAYLTAEGLHRLLLALGPNPTRSGLFELLKTYKESPKDAYPGCPLFARGDRRMGHSSNIFELSGGKWKQIKSCVDVGG